MVKDTFSTTDSLDVLKGHRVSWGAIIAGVTLMISLGWLLLLLGSAVGVGIADATDLAAMGDGLGIGSVIWILLSTVLATFAGGLLSAKMSGTIDDRIGALHGLSVWSVGTLLIIVLTSSGISSTMNGLGNAVGTANQASTTIVTSGGDEQGNLPESVTTSIAAIVKRQAANVISETSMGESGPRQNEVRNAINSLSASDVGAISSALIAGDTEDARSQLTQKTDLTDGEIASIVNGAKQKAKQWSESENAEQAENWLNEQISAINQSVSQSVGDLAGDEVTSQEISRSINQLDMKVLVDAGKYLLSGEPEMAKDVLSVNTRLSESQIQAIVDGAEREAQQLIAEAKAELNEVTETVATYTQAVLWSSFIASALGLIAGLAGGHLGAGSVRRVYGIRQ